MAAQSTLFSLKLYWLNRLWDAVRNRTRVANRLRLSVVDEQTDAILSRRYDGEIQKCIGTLVVIDGDIVRAGMLYATDWGYQEPHSPYWRTLQRTNEQLYTQVREEVKELFILNRDEGPNEHVNEDFDFTRDSRRFR